MGPAPQTALNWLKMHTYRSRMALENLTPARLYLTIVNQT